MCCALPTLAACIAEPADSDPTAAVGGEDTPFEELGAVAIAEPSTGTAASIDKDDANKSIAPARLGASSKAKLVNEVKTTFALPALEVNEEEVIEVTIDDPRIVDRAALGLRYMSWGDPETSAVTEGYARYYPNLAAQSPYMRLRVNASFGDLYLVDCRVTDGTYGITVQDVSGMGPGVQDIQTSTSEGHLVFAFDPGPGGYKQLYISRSTGKTQYWALWGCEVTPLQ
jgi:hypothetical protein